MKPEQAEKHWKEKYERLEKAALKLREACEKISNETNNDDFWMNQIAQEAIQEFDEAMKETE